MFFTLLGYWPHGGGGGRSLKGLVHNLLMQFFTLGSSKIKVFKTGFYDIVITQNDHARYLCFSKHVLGRIYVYFTLFGYWPHGGGVSQGIGTQPAYAVFQPGQLKNRSFRNLFF